MMWPEPVLRSNNNAVCYFYDLFIYCLATEDTSTG